MEVKGIILPHAFNQLHALLEQTHGETVLVVHCHVQSTLVFNATTSSQQYKSIQDKFTPFDAVSPYNYLGDASRVADFCNFVMAKLETSSNGKTSVLLQEKGLLD